MRLDTRFIHIIKILTFSSCDALKIRKKIQKKIAKNQKVCQMGGGGTPPLRKLEFDACVPNCEFETSFLSHRNIITVLDIKLEYGLQY